MLANIRRRWHMMMAIMGPGFLAAMADNDAGGIAMYMQAGAEYGYAVLLVVAVSIVCLMICQELAARTGLAGGLGLASLIRRQYGVRISLMMLLLLIAANMATTVAEFAGVVAAGRLLGISDHVAVISVGAMLAAMAVSCCYQKIERILLLLCLSFGAYLAGGYVAMPTAEAVWEGLLVIDYREMSFWLMTIGVIGTTVTPWGQFYLQSSIVDKGLDSRAYHYLRIDVLIGSLLTGLIALAIVCMGAEFWKSTVPYTSLLQSGEVLSGLFGTWARWLFGAGLIGASVLAAFILPLSTSYAVCEMLGIEYGLDRSPRQAPVFFAVYFFMLICGMIGALLFSADLLWVMIVAQIINGILLLPILFCTVLIAQQEDIMGVFVSSAWQNRLAVFVLSVLTIVEVGLVLTI